MKRITALLICVLLCFAQYTIYARNTEYKIPDLDISVSVPQQFYVFMRDTSPDSEMFSELGLTYEGVMSVFESQNIYLEAMDTENFNQIVIKCSDTSEANYFDLGADGLYKAILAEETRLEADGREITDADLFEADSADFAKIYSDADASRIEYTTVYNGKKYEISYTDFDKDITPEEEENIDNLVESVSFAQPPQKKQQTSPTKEEPEGDIVSDSSAVQPTSPVSDNSTTDSDDVTDKLVDILIFVVIAIVVCTIPVLIFRYIFVRRGLKKAGAFLFAVAYSAAMCILVCRTIDDLGIDTLGRYLCVVPLLWGFVIYKIVKYR